MTEPAWKLEIIALHDLFETYFLGETDDLTRVDAVLAADFSMVGPDGTSSIRAEVMAAITAGHGHSSSLTINTLDHQLVASDPAMLIAEYIEEHVLSDRTNRRRSTVVFTPDEAAPHGLVWRRVQETWLDH